MLECVGICCEVSACFFVVVVVVLACFGQYLPVVRDSDKPGQGSALFYPNRMLKSELLHFVWLSKHRCWAHYVQHIKKPCVAGSMIV